MSFNLPDAITTQRQLRQVIEELKNLNPTADKQTAYDQLSYEAQALVGANQSQWEDSSDIAAFTQKLEQAYQNTPVFDVILPTYPHDTFLSELSGWFRREIHPNSLLDIKVRRSIGGGMVLRSKNRLFDLSLRPQILQSRDKIPEVLRRV